MKKHWLLWLVNILILGLTVGVSAAGMDVTGSWMGKLEVGGGASLRVVINITQNANGVLSGTMDSPDQGVKGIPVSKVTLEGQSLRVEIKSANAVYEGTVNAEGTAITGTWKQGMAKLPLNMEKLVGPVANNRPQEPVKPYPYTEKEVTYENKVDNIKLAGTLTMPKTGGPFPAVILITGSGAQDRDETLMGHKPFLVIADYLTRRGIAVLRVDDRGVGGSTGNPATATTADFAKDVRAGLEFLQSQPEINAKQIGLIGHSEGGIIAPMVAAENPEVAFIVLLAGTGLPGADIIELQVKLIAEANGVSAKDVAEAVATQKRFNTILVENPDPEVAAEILRPVLQAEIDKLSPAEKQSLGNVDQYITATLQSLLVPWNMYFLRHDPRPVLEKVQCPVLALNGTKDLQVPAKENLLEIEKALKAGGNKAVTIVELPGLNHLFQTATTGSPNEYGLIEETISPDALKVVGDWILQQVKIQ